MTRPQLQMMSIIAAAVFALSSCTSQLLSDRRSAGGDSFTYYQPPVTPGGTGRIVRMDQTPASEGPRQHNCGEISPSYSFVYEWSQLPTVSVTTEIFDYPPKSEVSYEDIRANGPIDFQNLFNVMLFMDSSWSPFLGLGHSISINPSKDAPQRTFSVEEVECWADAGDQVSNLIMATFFWALGYDVENEQVTETAARVFPIKSEYEARLFQIDHLKRAAEPPLNVDSCDRLGASCPSQLLKPFPLGVPQANYKLVYVAEQEPELVDNRTIMPRNIYYQRALRGGVGRLYYELYGIRYRTPAH